MVSQRVAEVAFDDESADLLQAIMDAERRAAAAQAEATAAKLAYRDYVEEHARLTRDRLAHVARASAHDDIGYLTATPVAVVAGQLCDAELLATALPALAAAHTQGDVDTWRIRVILSAARKLTCPESLASLDERVTAIAGSKTVGQLRAWLRAFVIRVEPEHHTARTQREFADRGAWINPTDDVNAHLEVMLSAIDAERLDGWLEKTARSLGGPDDDRTLDQKRADLVADVLLGRRTVGGEATGRTATGATIAITIPLTALAGLDDAPGITWEHQTALPAELVRDLAAEPGTLFYRVFTDPAGRVLDVTEMGRFASERLSTALEIRDQTCRVAHCNVPATRCDKDHQIPYPQGHTCGSNMGCLCRRHHRLKTLGRLKGAILTRHTLDP